MKFPFERSCRRHKRHQRGAYLVPTLLPSYKVPPMMENNPFFTDAIKAKAHAASSAARTNFAKAVRAGVKIAFGTDTGVTPHGNNAEEFVLMVENGMTPGDPCGDGVGGRAARPARRPRHD